MNLFTRSLSLIMALGVATAQMELRDEALYARQQFRAAEPAVGALAPELVLTDLDGNQHALSDWRGRIVVLIQAGFT